jgi:hypothetical protein
LGEICIVAANGALLSINEGNLLDPGQRGHRTIG